MARVSPALRRPLACALAVTLGAGLVGRDALSQRRALSQPCALEGYVWRRGDFAFAEEVYFYRGGAGQWIDLRRGRREDLGDFRWRVQGDAIAFDTSGGTVRVPARRARTPSGTCLLHLARNPFLREPTGELTFQGLRDDESE